MYDRKKLINAIGQLSNRLFEITSSQNNDLFFEVGNQNPWFTPEFIRNSFRAIAGAITQDKVNTFCRMFDYPLPDSPKAVGLILAGNIPLSGFFDILMTLLSGNKLILQLSSSDPILPKFVIGELIKIYPELENSILFKDPHNNIYLKKMRIKKMKRGVSLGCRSSSCFQTQHLTSLKSANSFRLNIDAIIATGSNNSAMYFNYYFGHLPHLIRKNRCSVAVISNESNKYLTPTPLPNLSRANAREEEGHEILLKKQTKNVEVTYGFADDLLLYFGLGCRSISKLYIIGTENDNKFSEHIFNLVEPYRYFSKHPKYANNYLYQKTLLTMNNIKHVHNGFLLLVPEKKICSPVSVCHYEYFKSENEVLKEIEANRNSIQCIVSESGHFPDSIPFGKAQQPELWDFADGVNVMEFLGRL